MDKRSDDPVSRFYAEVLRTLIIVVIKSVAHAFFVPHSEMALTFELRGSFTKSTVLERLSRSQSTVLAVFFGTRDHTRRASLCQLDRHHWNSSYTCRRA